MAAASAEAGKPASESGIEVYLQGDYLVFIQVGGDRSVYNTSMVHIFNKNCRKLVMTGGMKDLIE